MLSIVITYYNGEKFIDNCIDSIINSHKCSEKKIPFEIILMIDSMDDSLFISDYLTLRYNEYINKNLFIYTNEKNLGVSKSRNLGLSISKYRYFAIIDQDDYVLQNYFSIVESQLNDHYCVYLFNGYINYINDAKQIPFYFIKPKFSFKSLILKNTFIYTPGQLIFDSKYVSKNNLFIETSLKYKGCDDWAAYLNILLNTSGFKYKYIRSKVFVYCFHNLNFSNDSFEMINSSISVLDYFNNLTILNKGFRRYILFSYKMQNFYLLKDVYKASFFTLFKTCPSQFIWHYLLSFIYVDRVNRLVFNVRKFFFR
ncbi:glycosyltransferase family 2 protein [Runella slithyformis]|uniref:Glycosyl transferase family 2 n=1 Tax=Runella slithyformis (strain ATCC 29530 / DSM 19594 / LMG 11500 / NCIMB 11436 / LSU 4) TaxID=761193 RepID=A0A7U3ZPJ6_RUNSL|nr:glycosyltransferase [Runella slithyformis]AEI51010.1 glycosyl transferase family 2 [Runella slithyformis DSM 19594]